MIKSVAGINSFRISAEKWVTSTNIRDYANINELIRLSNMKNLNSEFINEVMPQLEHLLKLDPIA